MFTNVSKMKNKSEIDFLQKELEFYTNLLSQHEKIKEKNVAMPCTSSASTFVRRPSLTYSNQSSKPNGVFSFNKSSKVGVKTVKKDSDATNSRIHNYQKIGSISSLHLPKTQLVSNHNSLPSKRTVISKHNLKVPIPASKATNQSKFTKTNISKYTYIVNHGKKSPDRNVSSKLLVNKIAPTKSDSTVIVNERDSGKANANTLMNKGASVVSNTKVNKRAESNSRTLMGEIVAVTERLKIKSGSNSNDSSAKLPGSLSRFKKINSSVKVKDLHAKAKNLQSGESTDMIESDSCSTSLNKASSRIATECDNVPILPTGSGTSMKIITSPGLQFTTSHQKDNSKMHLRLLEKLNAVEKLLNATTKSSSEVLNKVGKYSTKNKVKSEKSPSFKSPKVSDSCHRQKLSASVGLSRRNSLINSKFLQRHNFKFTKVSPTNNFTQKHSKVVEFNQKPELKNSPASKETRLLPKSASLIKTKYKVVNKTHPLKRLSTKARDGDGAGESIKMPDDQSVQKNLYKLVNNHKTNSKLKKVPKNRSKLIFVKGNYSLIENTCSPLKRVPNKVLKRHSPSLYKSNFEHRQSLNVNESYKLCKSLLEDTMKSPSESSGIDVDLLLELAAENKEKLSKSVARRTLYKSRNRLINFYSVQARTAKMIKTKYFNPYKRSVDSKSLLFPDKRYKGYKNNYTSNVSKSCKSFSLKHKGRKCNQKKIVYLGGEKFIIGSTGKTLTKLPNQSTNFRKMSVLKSIKGKSVVKTHSPVSKIIASRALNRSINRALSASTKKKMQKINTYCMFYNRFGRCNKGIKCPFVHDPSKIAVCTRFLRGTCKSDSCLFSHEVNPGKMAICSFFLQDACTKEDCPYRHEKLSPDAELCKPFVQGYCPEGKDCKKAHILICSKFLQGSCDKGSDCTFPHPLKKEKFSNPKSSDDNQKKDEFQLETVLRYFESNPQESLTKGLVVPRIRSLPEQPSFISLTMDDAS